MSNSISTPVTHEFTEYVREIQQIGAVEQILETIAAITGLGFVAVAHVTDHSWTTCAVLDKLGFGLKVGDGLEVTTTLCDEVRATASVIVIDHVREDEQYRDHHTPRIYGFQSYFSIPIFRPDGTYFGTLCGLDPTPKILSAPATRSMLQLFAQLISKQLEVERVHSVLRNELITERHTAELREQFIAVLGHDLRTPLGAIQNGIDLLRLKHPDPASMPVLQRIKRSLGRVNALVDDVVDFTRGRMGGGIALDMRRENDLAVPFGQVIDELRDLHPGQKIVAQISPGMGLLCDVGRLSQLLSNLLKNAIVHGGAGTPISVVTGTQKGRFMVAVSNHGDALPPELIAQLFKPFWRASSGSAHEGLGLGLYIVSEIARSHGGNMNVTSRNGMVTFTFSMPNHSHTAICQLTSG
jgi:signal transduction histidine kinase